MITKQEFIKIDTEVKLAINEAFDYVKTNCSDQKYVLLLADADYIPRYANNKRAGNPYVLENMEDHYRDKTRLSFFLQYVRTFYTFPDGATQTEDNEPKINTELMIYSHLWESKPFLKQLYRLTSLIDKRPYEWIIKVPDMSKHKFIRIHIRDILKRKKMKLADIIAPKAFHTSLRNAFAHSEYDIDDGNQLIWLDTYTGKKWDIEKLTYDEWTTRFVYTSMLSYHFMNIKYARREQIVKDLNKDEFVIIYPVSKFRSIPYLIGYDEIFNKFIFKRRL